MWTPPAHKRDKSTSAPFFLRGHRSLARSLNFDVINLCCSQWNFFVVLVLDIEDGLQNDDSSQFFCTSVLGYSRKCKLQCSCPSQRTTNTWCPTGSRHQQCSDSLLPRFPSASSHHTGDTSYQALLQKSVWNVHNFEHRTAWSNVQHSATMPNFTVNGPTKENRFNTPLNKLA